MEANDGKQLNQVSSSVLPVPVQRSKQIMNFLWVVSQKHGEFASWARRCYYVEIINIVID